MRILVVVHLFPPKDSAGTEVYTRNLSHEFKRRGNEVFVYHTERDPDRPQYELTRVENDGLPTFRAIHNYRFQTFRDTYWDERMEENFREILAEVKPDVVHCQHLHLHSMGYLTILEELNIPVIYTLAEYLLLCPRNGWLIRPDYSLCDGPTPRQCGHCTLGLPPPNKTILPQRLDRFLGKLKQRIGMRDVRYVEANRQRNQEIKEQLAKVDLFIAPSMFLRDQFLKNEMIEKDRIIHSDYGFRVKEMLALKKDGAPKKNSGPLRIGFTGAISVWKGVDVLVEAMSGISESEAVCEIYGDLDAFPPFVKRLRQLATRGNVHFKGRFDNTKIAEVLDRFDVLVVPSIWFENSPLTIHEAFLYGVPVITSGEGGMAELVEDGVNGLHFRLGDKNDLQAKIQRLVNEPELLSTLRSNMPMIKDIEDDARHMEQHFQALLDGKKPVA